MLGEIIANENVEIAMLNEKINAIIAATSFSNGFSFPLRKRLAIKVTENKIIKA
jgi:hypothetical protein